MVLYDNDSYREEFIAGVYDLLSDDPDWWRANQIIDLFDCAPAVEEPPNPLLTLAELREMDGCPVWVESISSFNNLDGHWDILTWEDGKIHFPYCGEEIDEMGLVFCGITWYAYRKKPEEEQHG